MGYSAEQIRGAHHRQFCPDAFYQQHPDFWEQLSRGELKQGKSSQASVGITTLIQ